MTANPPEPAAQTDTGPTEQTITQWANGGLTTRLAAHLAREIRSGKYPPYYELPPTASLADDWDASPRTVARAKALLAQHGMLRRGTGAYWVT